jgi:hypothetical protein
MATTTQIRANWGTNSGTSHAGRAGGDCCYNARPFELLGWGEGIEISGDGLPNALIEDRTCNEVR